MGLCEGVKASEPATEADSRPDERAFPQEEVRGNTMLGQMLTRLAQDRTAVAGLVIVVILVLVALFGPWIAPHDPIAINLGNSLAPPSGEYPLGTDRLGRCILSRIIYGSRTSLGTAGLVTLITLTIGVVLGSISGFYGGWVDDLLMRIVDIINAFPSMILALAIVGVLGAGLINMMIAMAAIWWVSYGRIVRGMVLSLRERDYILAVRTIGAKNGRIVFRHILPNIMPPVIVLVTLDLGAVILTISSLSFLGLGAQPPTPEWGAMLNEARTYVELAPLQMIFPGLAILLAVLGFNLLGDGLRDVLDPIHLRTGKS